MPASQKRVDANRRNARKSTGPRTAEGKAVSSRNAVTHGLYATDIVLNSPYLKEDPDRYRLFVAQLVSELRPRSLIQEQLVIKIANSLWRYQRVIRAEAATINRNIATTAFAFKCTPLDDNPDPDDQTGTGQKHRDILDSHCVLSGSEALTFLRYELRLDRQITRAYKLLSHLQRLDKLEAQDDKRNYRPRESPALRRVGPDPYRYPDDPPPADSLSESTSAGFPASHITPETVSGTSSPAPAGPHLPPNPTLGNAPSKPPDRTPPSERPNRSSSAAKRVPHSSAEGGEFRTAEGAEERSAVGSPCTNTTRRTSQTRPTSRRRTKKRKNEPIASASNPPFT